LSFIAGAAAVIALVVGGIMYVTSAGDEKRVEAAKNTILYAVIGVVVALLGFAIANFVIGGVSTGTPN
jgi:archaellum component FlaF (FlaF/FlaG flagellin family)